MYSSALRFSGVAKRYGRNPVLHDVSFDIARGDFFALIGVNGAGKTTLLKCLFDFCAIDRGRIEIFDVPHRAEGARNRLSFLPERFTPPHYVTGGEFLRHVLAMHGVPHEDATAVNTLRALDLDPAVLARPVRAYSKGMTQKLGLAACLLAHKELYVLDEPTSGLDPKARALFKTQLRALKNDTRTLFFTSHALADVAEICDRVAVMHEGRLRFVGTPDTLRDRYAADDLEQAFLRCIEDVPVS